MWSWVLHRISGATIFFFLFVHVLDAAMLRVSPQTYNEVLSTYKTPIVGLMEFGLVAAVLFHAFNGIRVILIDFWSKGPRYQKLMWWVVAIAFLLLLRTIWMSNHIDMIFIMTRGGPGFSNYTEAIYSFMLTQQLEVGYSSAVAVALAVILMIVSAFYVRHLARNVLA